MARALLATYADRVALPEFRTKGGMSPSQLRIEVLAGLTVALALVPEAVAFAFLRACTGWWVFTRRSSSV